MKKKVLMVATYGDFFAAFEVDNIKILNDLGIEVYLCANWEDSRYNYKTDKLKNVKYKTINIPFRRSPFSMVNIINFFKLNKLLRSETFFSIDCHNAVVGVYARLSGYINKVPKVIYTAHGFQFFKGGSILDWIIYYPIEKFLSKITDILIVINNEDYEVTKQFHCPKVVKIPGVGVDTTRFSRNYNYDNSLKKKSLGLPDESFIVLSVGELSKRKNHQVIIKALAKLNEPNIYYLIVGQGKEHHKLTNLIKELNLESNIFLLGHRDDILELNNISDIVAFPSKREGLGIAAIESLSMGLPLISTNVQGINDYSIDGITGYTFKYNDVTGFSEAINLMYKNIELRNELSNNARKISLDYDQKVVNKIMRELYSSLVTEVGSIED